jgi:hypothetical protein
MSKVESMGTHNSRFGMILISIISRHALMASERSSGQTPSVTRKESCPCPSNLNRVRLITTILGCCCTAVMARLRKPLGQSHFLQACTCGEQWHQMPHSLATGFLPGHSTVLCLYAILAWTSWDDSANTSTVHDNKIQVHDKANF